MAVPSPGPPTTADRVQVDLLRKAGVARRSALGLSLSATVIEMAREASRRRHPGYGDREVLLAFVELSYGKDLAARLRRHLHGKS